MNNQRHVRDTALVMRWHENNRREKKGSPYPSHLPPNPCFSLLSFSCHLMTNVLSLPWCLLFIYYTMFQTQNGAMTWLGCHEPFIKPISTPRICCFVQNHVSPAKSVSSYSNFCFRQERFFFYTERAFRQESVFYRNLFSSRICFSVHKCFKQQQ